jgi:pimeloyl-ACP methyl ester carboxylesterase
MLQQADQGNFAPLLGQKKWVADDLADHMTSGVQASILCAEDADQLMPNPEDADTIMGNAAITRFKSMCQFWPHESQPAHFHDPLVSPVPTLVLSGELDPVTPPAYGAEVVQSLSNARQLTVTGQGHSVIGVGCMPRLVSRFVDTLDVKVITGKCLEKLGQTPAFISYNGAAP